MADESAVASEVETPDTPTEARPPSEPEANTAEVVQETEAIPSGSTVETDAEAEKVKFAEAYFRKRVGEIGNSVIRVKPESRQKLADRPTLIEEQEAEIAALRRIASGQQASGPNQRTAAVPEKDDSEDAAKRFLARRGIKEGAEGYADLVEYEADRIRFHREETRREIEKSKPNTTALMGDLTKAQREAAWREELPEVMASAAWTDPKKGFEAKGRFYDKLDEMKAGKSKFKTPNQLLAEVEADMAPPAPRVASKVAVPTMGATSSGRVAASAGTDPFHEFDEACRAAGKDPKTALDTMG